MHSINWFCKLYYKSSRPKITYTINHKPKTYSVDSITSMWQNYNTNLEVWITIRYILIFLYDTQANWILRTYNNQITYKIDILWNVYGSIIYTINSIIKTNTSMQNRNIKTVGLNYNNMVCNNDKVTNTKFNPLKHQIIERNIFLPNSST